MSLTTLAGRLVLPYVGYTPHLEAIQAGRHVDEARKARQRQERKAQQAPTEEQEEADHTQEIETALLMGSAEEPAKQATPVDPDGITFGAAKLWRDPRTKQWYLLVTLALPVPDVTSEQLPTTMGIDLGQRYLAVSTTTTNQTQFFPGGPAVHQGEAYQRVRQRLQHKGTSGATWRLRQMVLKERRFKANVNHATAKALVQSGMLIGLEDLTHIRERTQRKGKRNRRKARKWAFAELKGFVAYKALLVGSRAITVDADYTSQQCPRCGYRAKANRPHKGLQFRCVHPTEPCGCDLHADLVGARQVCLRTLAVRQVWGATGQLSPAPDRSSDEAKAARLQGYAELRWRADPSPRL